MPPLEEAARLFAQLGDQASGAEMLSSVAIAQERTATPSDARQTWEEVRRLRVSLGDTPGELTALEGIVRMQRRGGAAREDIIPQLETALALASRLADKRREASMRNTLGILDWESGNYASALRHYERLLGLARELADQYCEGLALNSLGVTLSRLNRQEEARTVLEESITLNEESGQPLLQAHALAALADVCQASGRSEVAKACKEQSLTIRRRIAAKE